MVLAHVVVSLKGTRPHRTECKTCKGVHAYRDGPPAPRKAAAPKARRKTEYEKQMEGRETDGALPYKTSGVFSRDDIIAHPKFGIGLVTGRLDADKIEVLFPDGPKRLIIGR